MFFKKDVKFSLSLSHKSVDFHTSHKGFTLIELLIVTLFRKSPDGQVGIKFHNKGFTLIELLIVIGILAVLATVTLLVINPAQMFAEARDASRISDMDTINKALLYYQGVGGTNLGLTNKVYISIPSSQPNCSDLSLPALGTGYEYVCSDQAHYRNADGTGWIPVNFTSTQGTLGALLTSLPVDPVNTVPNGFYYTYISGSWALSATMESQKYLSEKAPNDGGKSATRFEVGNEIALDSNLNPIGDYSYRRLITINNIGNSNALIDYQVSVTADTASLISASKIKFDCGDVRFTDSDGITQLNYWIESGCNSANTKFWVKVSSISASATKTIYMYYGNASATSASDGDNTFIFFDDFLGTALDTNKWNAISGSPSVSNGNLVLPVASVGIKQAFTRDYVIRLKYNNNEGDHDFRMNIFADTNNSLHNFVNLLIPWEGGESRADKVINNGAFIAHYYMGGPYIYGTSLTVNVYYLYSSITTKVIKDNDTTVIPLISVDKYGDYVSLSMDTDNTNYFDWVLVRKYIDQEPTTSVGGEETL